MSDSTFTYNFYFDVGDWGSPVSGAGYIEGECYYNNSGLTKRLEEGEIFSRVKFNGELVFVGDYYTALESIRLSGRKVGAQIYRNTQLQASGELNLLGKWDANKKECRLKVEITDEYTNLIENYDVEHNILSVSPVVKCTVSKQQNYEYETSIVSDTINCAQTSFNLNIPHVGDNQTTAPTEYGGSIGSIWGLYQVVYSPQSVSPVLPGVYAVDFVIGRTFIREITYVLYDGDTWTDPGGGYIYIEDVNLSGRRYRKYGRPPVVADDWNNFGWEKQGIWNVGYITNNNNATDTENIDYDRFRILEDVIRYLVQQNDSSINFDSSSFTYFDNNNDLDNLLIAGLSDIVLNDSGEIKSNEQTIGDISLKGLFDYLKSYMKIYWELEEIGGSYYFRIKHRSEVLYDTGTLPGNDLTSFKGVNWTSGKSNYEFDLEKYSRLTRKHIAQNVDFIGRDVLFERLSEVFPNTKETSYNKIFVDIWNIQDNSGQYPGDSNDTFCLVSSDFINEEDELLGTFENVDFTNFTAYSPPTEGFRAAGAIPGTIEMCKSQIFDGGGEILSVQDGSTFKLTFNCTYYTGSSGDVKVILYDGAATMSGVYDVVSGQNTIYLTANKSDSSVWVVFYKDITATSGVDFRVSDIYFQLYDFIIRTRQGAFSGLAYANVELSQANIDAGHGQYEMYDQQATINDNNVTLNSVQLLKDRRQQDIDAPVHLSEIDMSKLVKTDLGNLEPEQLQIFFNKKFAKISGKL